MLGGVQAQLVEQLSTDPKCKGSNPAINGTGWKCQKNVKVKNGVKCNIHSKFHGSQN